VHMLSPRNDISERTHLNEGVPEAFVFLNEMILIHNINPDV